MFSSRSEVDQYLYVALLLLVKFNLLFQYVMAIHTYTEQGSN